MHARVQQSSGASDHAADIRQPPCAPEAVERRLLPRRRGRWVRAGGRGAPRDDCAGRGDGAAQRGDTDASPHDTSPSEPAALQPKRPNLAEIDPGGPATARAGSGNVLTARHTRTRIMTYAHRLTGYRITQGRASTAHHRTTHSQSFMCISGSVLTAQCMTHTAQTSSCILPSRRTSPQHAGSESP